MAAEAEQSRVQNTSPKVGYIHSPFLLEASTRNPRVNQRPAIVHSLIESVGLLNHPHISIVHPPSTVSDKALALFHSSDYIHYLKARDVNCSCEDSDREECDEEYGIGGDCPPFQGLYNYVCHISEGSLQAAKSISSGEYQLAINWYGGRHHGHRDKASGFCYCNDVVICILHLLKHFPRVLYIDTDIHHGDGVEQAFYYSSSVVTLSFHNYSPGYFPGTGSLESIGSGAGLYHTINVPLEEGVSDEQYSYLFKTVVSETVSRYKPCAVVYQCGADCLSGDPLGGFNLSLSALGQCMETILHFQLPTVVLGGGGYNFPNTARLWAYLTSIITGQPLTSLDIPEHKYFSIYSPGYQLMIDSGTRLNRNTDKNINQLLNTVLSNLSHI